MVFFILGGLIGNLFGGGGGMRIPDSYAGNVVDFAGAIIEAAQILAIP